MVALGGVVARLSMLRTDGVVYPDEVHQSLEQAHRLAFGYGLIPWEFEVGARCWLWPSLLVLPMKLADAVGAPPQLFARAFVAVLSGAAAWPIASLARVHGGGPIARLISAVVWSTLSLGVLLGSRALSETACVLPLTLGLALVLERNQTARWLGAGAALLTVAVMLRLQTAVFVAVVPVVLFARKERRNAGVLTGALFAGALLFGLFDLVTWGSFFHSAREYLRFNFVEGRAAEFGVEPWSYYPSRLWHSMWLAAPLLLLLASVAWRRAGPLLLIALPFVALHQATGHKELRFLLPALALAAVWAGLGVETLSERLPRRATSISLAALLCIQPPPGLLDFWKLGVSPNTRTPVADIAGPESRLLARAGKEKDVCGVVVNTRELGFTGAYAWLHRRIPLYDAMTQPPRSPEFANAVIEYEGKVVGDVLARDQGLVLVRVRPGCVEDTTFDWKLH